MSKKKSTRTSVAIKATDDTLVRSPYLQVDVASPGGTKEDGTVVPSKRIKVWAYINPSDTPSGEEKPTELPAGVDSAAITKALSAYKVVVVKNNPDYNDVKTDTDGDGVADKVAEIVQIKQQAAVV